MKCALIILAAALALAGCGQPESGEVQVDTYQQQRDAAKPVSVTAATQDRLIVERVQIIRDKLAYNERRGLYVIRDTQTGKEYVGLSGVGIAELGSHSSGKTTVPDER